MSDSSDLPRFANVRWVEVDLAAVRANFELLRGNRPAASLIPVVKADGYGVGAAEVARVLNAAGAELFAVADIEEGVQLRTSGVRSRVMLFTAPRDADGLAALNQFGLEPTADASEVLDPMRLAGVRQKIHLNLDGGMVRNGLPPGDLSSVLKRLAILKLVPGSVYTHLPFNSAGATGQIRAGLNAFRRVTAAHRHLDLHAASSAALLTATSAFTGFSHARVGLALYGLRPCRGFPSRLTLRPAVSVRCRVRQVRPVPPRAGLSYNHEFVTSRDSRIAVLPVGYDHGLPSCRGLRFLVGGRSVPQVGAVTMDSCLADVTDVPAVKAGDEVTILSADEDSGASAYDWQELAGWSPWRTLTAVGRVGHIVYRSAGEASGRVAPSVSGTV